MQRLVFSFDFISPFAYLAFERLPQVLQGCSYEVQYRPVLFAGLLQHWGQKGPAEVEPKRAWTFRHVHWLAQHHGVALQTPTEHPFNPLPLLRLALACSADHRPNRRVVETIFRHVWAGGGNAVAPERVAALAAQLAPVHDPAGPAVKQALRERTDAAMAEGVFGVPTITLQGRHFWGLDALPMLRDALQGGAWFDGPAWALEGAPRAGVQRRAAAPEPAAPETPPGALSPPGR
jgi:2-hydroxychromene-2-carboxylate isomerase